MKTMTVWTYTDDLFRAEVIGSNDEEYNTVEGGCPCGDRLGRTLDDPPLPHRMVSVDRQQFLGRRRGKCLTTWCLDCLQV